MSDTPLTGTAGLLGQLTLDEKAAMTAGVDLWHTHPVGRLGIGSLKLTDGPVGARGAHYTGGATSTCFPCGSALAATFDTELVGRVGEALAREVRAKHAHVLLAPTVNLHRSPLGGRHFECYSEDPYLTARLAVAYITGVQSEGVGACVKHYVCNDSEFERFTISSEVGERALREVYLAPFDAAVNEAGVWSVMAAYNKLHGTHCSEHPGLLTGILRDEWGWDGFVVSDWGATHSGAPAAAAGLDLEMPGPAAQFGPKLAAAVAGGELDEKALDAQVHHLLVALDRAGLLEPEAADASTTRAPEGSIDTPDVRALAREAAGASIVLLRNDSVAGAPVLPLDPARARSIAVIGPNAAVARIEGGGSALVTAPYAISPLEGIRAQAVAAGATVAFEQGTASWRSVPRMEAHQLRAPSGSDGFLVEYFGNDGFEGEPVQQGTARRSTFLWSAQLGPDHGSDWAVRLTADYVPQWTGEHDFTLTTTGRARLWIAGQLVVDAWSDGSDGSPVAVTTPGGRPVHGAKVRLEADQATPVVIDFAPTDDDVRWGRHAVDVRCRPPAPDDLLARAVSAARAADVAVVVVGLDSDWETEGRDRETMALPPGQDGLVEAVLAANPRTVVVLNAGSPVTMPWADRVPAIVQLYYGGQEAGNALADVLFGTVNPSGRLPTTVPVRLEDTPSFLDYPGDRGQVFYGEGIFVGHRWYEARGIAPRFPFGHGLSYTTFEYGAIETRVGADGVRVSLDVTNTGSRPGAEVVQLYVRDVEATVSRPRKELKGFARVSVGAGQTERAELLLRERDLAFWDPSAAAFVVEPGEFEVLVGASSADIRAVATFTWPS